MRTAIGGYFEFETFYGKEYHNGLADYNYERNALRALLQVRKFVRIWLPYYLCHAVEDVCQQEQIQVEHYRIDKRMLPIFPQNIKQQDAVLVVNYFGRLSRTQIRRYKAYHSNLIVDNAQAFFQKPIEQIDTLYTCRKFFGVPDGAYLSTDAPLATCEGAESVVEKMEYLVGRYEKQAEKFFPSFQKEEAKIEGTDIKRMSGSSHNILRVIDYKSVAYKRYENYQYLAAILGKYNNLNFPCNSVPFAYPFLHKNGMVLRRKLAEKRIYVPTLWPDLLNRQGNAYEEFLAQNLLALPCDQRYTVADMKTVADEILSEVTR